MIGTKTPRSAKGLDLRPMLATLSEEAPLQDSTLIYEPKYDGIRAVIEIEAGSRPRGVRIWSRLGNDKTTQFPEIVRALDTFRRRLTHSVVLDGEIVALDDAGEPTGFHDLQGRIHLTGIQSDDPRLLKRRRVAFIAFDILRDSEADLRDLPLVGRRARLERVLDHVGSPAIRLSEFVAADGTQLYVQALARGWEGLIAKRADSRYLSGRRSADWRKIKVVRRQEFVIGGWTEPRELREHFGALLLGAYEADGLQYVGHTGTGFSHADLVRVRKILRHLETRTCPFLTRPKTNERPHWVEPKLVAEVQFSEWTPGGRLRHPVFLGLRNDVAPETVRREPAVPAAQKPARLTRELSQPPLPPAPRGAAGAAEPVPAHSSAERLIAQLQAIEDRTGAGVLTFDDGDHLRVSELHKRFWPDLGLTKGDLLRYYVSVAPFLLPTVKDRPLVMRRFPNGITGKAFYQQRAPEPAPPHVRVEAVPGDRDVPGRLIGGSLKTLLYMTQLAVISQDPWFSCIQSPDHPDYAVLDLDPMPGVGWARVLDVARWAHDELEALGVQSYPKTSGVSGLHIYVPLRPGTSYASSRLFCQMVATLVAQKHPDVASVVRTVQSRGQTVYIDYLQNVYGKTLATAYSARASDFAGVSCPLTWKELDVGVDRRDFTISTMLDRLRMVGDLWSPLRLSPGVDLRIVLEKARARLV